VCRRSKGLKTFSAFLLLYCGFDVTPRMYRELENVRTITKWVCMTRELLSFIFAFTYGCCKSGATCNALSNYLIILLDDMVYVYILYDFDDYVTYL